ncbi:DnaJ domain-containing protein [Crenothrix sp.]|uniref:DnaJ domain-containing protein n=1 Tax=Crenothrix sp. TaxID=3100433 RepID=UPI00374D9B0C
MIPIVLLLALTLGFFTLRSLVKENPALIAKYLKTLLWCLGGGVLVLLMLTGRLNGVLALIGVAVASAFRLAPLLLRYAPQLHRLWWQFKGAKQGQGQYQQQSQQQTYSRPPKNGMSAEEAYQVLGLTKEATQQDIIGAHRKLMQKIHPDRGGSDYLAAQINLAKKVLIKK